MPSQWLAGQLVEIVGEIEAADIPDDWIKVNPKLITDKQDLKGKKAQLSLYNEVKKIWMVCTFDSCVCVVKETNLRELTTEDVEGLDAALGPRSDPDIMGRNLIHHLSSKGYAHCRFFISSEDLTQICNVADQLSTEGQFSRMPSELEASYIGRECTGKTKSLNPDEDEDYVKNSPLSGVDEVLDLIGKMLQPGAADTLGFGIERRAESVLTLPLDKDEEDLYPPPEITNREAHAFLQTMWRGKLQVVVNVGPSPINLYLFPKYEADQDTTVNMEPGTLTVFATDRYRFSREAKGKSLTIVSWFLDAERKMSLDVDSIDSSQFQDMPITGAEKPKSSDPICVVSLSTKYAMNIDEPWKLWMGYGKASMDTFIEWPLSRWDKEQFYDPDADAMSMKSYTCHGGFSEGIELFDNKFFDISIAEARSMDPTQRQVLEVCYVALHGGGYEKKDLGRKSENIACFVGLDKNEWGAVPKEDFGGGFGTAGGANAITSNRFNYCMNLKGASLTIDTACSASLVATHTGRLYLLYKHYDPSPAVIACGVNLLLTPGSFVGCCAAGMLSHNGRCFTYNASADGYARGESTAAHCMKPKSFNRDDGDYALCAGSHVNQDGRSASLTAPNGPSQERCFRAVMKEVNLQPPDIETTECHGTGTSLGDPIEIGAYKKVMMLGTERHEPVGITSSKSNIGHCEGSAGVGGFIKCVLMATHAEITPNCHMRGLNPHLDMEGFPGIITTENCVMRGDASFNGVLSFGFGGTNACAQIWGHNITTSRQPSAETAKKRFVQQIENACPDVTIVGDDWEEWEVDGPGRDDPDGCEWEVAVDDDGVVEYMEKDIDEPYLGDSYDLIGTFSNWDYVPMEADEVLEGLHYATVTIGSKGEEEFQIVGDQDENMIFHPDTERCTKKSAEVCGPDEVGHEKAWVIKGSPGDRYRVEFYKSEAEKVSVTWRKEK